MDARRFFEDLYYRYGRRDKELAERAATVPDGEHDQGRWAREHQDLLGANRWECFERHRVPDWETAVLPAEVRDAMAFYFRTVPTQWWGAPALLRCDAADPPVYAVRVTTDGDDGWLEVYGLDGKLLGAARTYLELLAWGERDAIRATVHRGSYPPELADRMSRTRYRQPAAEWSFL